MDEAQSLRQIAHTPTPFSTWLGVVLLFFVFGAIVLAVIGPSPRGADYEQKRAKDREKKLQDLRKQDAAALTGYAWVDKQKGLAHIPIERAMELTMGELAAKKPAPAGPIATPQPETPAAATGVATPPGSPLTPAPAASAAPTGTPVEGHGSRAQPAAATNPPGAAPGTQPGPGASPAASQPPTAVAPVAPSPANQPSPPGSPLPVRGKTPQNF